MHLPYEAQFICIRACNETAAVAVFGDTYFAGKVIGGLFTAGRKLRPGQTVEEANTSQWNSLRGGSGTWRVTYRYLRGMRLGALEPRPAAPFPTDHPLRDRFFSDGLLKADGTPIEAFAEGHVTFTNDYPGHCLASCVDTTFWARIDPTGLLEIYGTPFALRSLPVHLNLGPHQEGYLQVQELDITFFTPGPSAPLSANELVETGERSGWSFKGIGRSGRGVMASTADGRAHLKAENWRGLAHIVQLCERAARQDVHGTASEWFDGIRFRIRIAANQDHAPVVLSRPTYIDMLLTYEHLRRFRDQLIASYGTTRKFDFGKLEIVTVAAGQLSNTPLVGQSSIPTSSRSLH